MLTAALRNTGEPGADFHALGRIQAHHGVGDIGIEPVVQRFAQAYRNVLRHHANFRADGIFFFADRVEIGFEFGHDSVIRCEESVLCHIFPTLKCNFLFAHLAHITANHDAIFLMQPLFGHRARGHGRRGQPRRRTPAAAIIANAVLLQIRIVGMAGPESIGDIAVIFTALIFVADQKRDRGAGGLAFEHAGEYLYRIGFFALRHMARGAGFAPVEIDLQIFGAQAQARRATIHHAADGRAVGFAEVGNAK